MQLEQQVILYPGFGELNSSFKQIVNKYAILTKVQFDTEIFDTDNAYDNYNYRFTPQVAGKYFVYVQDIDNGNMQNISL